MTGSGEFHRHKASLLITGLPPAAERPVLDAGAGGLPSDSFRSGWMPITEEAATSGHFSAGHLTKRCRPMTVKRAITGTA
jgi:hypothetical protein